MTHKINSVCFNYYVSDVSILRTDCIKDLCVMSDSKLHFHCYVDNVGLRSQTLRTFGLIRYITYNFSSVNSCLK
jgi:hypothetical protein